jgi:hypothetical protein
LILRCAPSTPHFQTPKWNFCCHNASLVFIVVFCWFLHRACRGTAAAASAIVAALWSVMAFALATSDHIPLASVRILYPGVWTNSDGPSCEALMENKHGGRIVHNNNQTR